jgi:hypothetical protein
LVLLPEQEGEELAAEPRLHHEEQVRLRAERRVERDDERVVRVLHHVALDVDRVVLLVLAQPRQLDDLGREGLARRLVHDEVDGAVRALPNLALKRDVGQHEGVAVLVGLAAEERGLRRRPRRRVRAHLAQPAVLGQQVGVVGARHREHGDRRLGDELDARRLVGDERGEHLVLAREDALVRRALLRVRRLRARRWRLVRAADRDVVFAPDRDGARD